MYVPDLKVTRSRRAEALLLALALAAVFACSFAVLQRTQRISPHIYGVEGYSHMAVARLIRAEGIPREFPWMPFTVYRTVYADLELLHHLALAPFAGNGDPEILERRAKTAASVFGAALLTLFYGILRRCRCPGALLWTAALVCGAGGFFIRLARPRPEVLSLVLLLSAVPLFSHRCRRHWPHLLLGLLYTLTGPAPQLVVGMSLLFLLGRRLAGERPVDWRMPLYTLAGTAAGVLAHPDRWDFARLLALLNWRTMLAGLISGSGVPASIQPMESKAPGLDDLLLHNELVVLPLAALLLALLVQLARRKETVAVTGETVSLFLCSLASLGLTVTATRFTLFWALFTTLLSAFLLRDLLNGAGGTRPAIRWRLRAAVPALILFAAAGIRTHDFLGDQLSREAGTIARPAMSDIGAILDAEAGAGEVVFHTRWIHFPQLFFLAPRQYYLLGANPMLMLAHGEQYLDIWQDLRQGKLADPYPFIRGLFKSRFLVTSKYQERLLRRLDSDPRFTRRYQGHGLILFTLKGEDLGFITSWQVAPLTGSPADGEKLPPLTPYHQSAPAEGIPLGFIDFRPFFPLGDMAPPAALAEIVVELDQAVENAEIRIGSSGPFQLELNGELLLVSKDANRMALIDQWRCPADLAAGRNRLRVIAARTPRDWGFFLRVVDEAGRPIQFDRPRF